MLSNECIFAMLNKVESPGLLTRLDPIHIILLCRFTIFINIYALWLYYHKKTIAQMAMQLHTMIVSF